jgi:hypothetical protein
MVSDWLPDLPFDKYYKYLASIGTAVLLLSLFVQTTFLDNRVVFEMGGVAVIFGVLGWLVEKFWMDYEANVNMEWQHAVRASAGTKKSPYDFVDVNRLRIPWVLLGSRLLLLLAFVGIEIWIYVFR